MQVNKSSKKISCLYANVRTYFDLAEIKEAVWACDGNKSPGPDGYNFGFIKEFWELLKDDLKSLLDEFHATGRWPRGTNSSFITLIPKVDPPLSLNDFRPNSLVGCLYKVVTKILASRIKRALPKVIDCNQFAFLGGRSMLGSVVIANESVHEAKSTKTPQRLFLRLISRSHMILLDEVFWFT